MNCGVYTVLMGPLVPYIKYYIAIPVRYESSTALWMYYFECGGHKDIDFADSMRTTLESRKG